MTFRFGMNRVPALAAMLVAGTALTAQVNTGTLAGAVKDAQGSPIAGVRVSISSPALFQPRVLTTGAAGDWVAPLLPPGTYKVTISKEGWVGSEASNLRVGVGTNFRQDLTMRPMAANTGTTVEVVASAGEVDKTDTKAGANFSADQLATLPGSSRGFGGAADLAPGLVAGASGSYSIRGGATANTRYTVNGSDVKDDLQGELTGTFYIEDNVEDVQVILSPLNARNGRATGGSLNVVTKTGGNDFHGSMRGQVYRNGWNAQDRDFIASIGNQVADKLQRQYQLTFNGPIIKDRLWFALGSILNPSQTYDYTTGRAYNATTTGPVKTGDKVMDAALNAGPGNNYAWTRFDENTPYHQKYDSSYYEGKITGAITADHTVEVAFSNSKSEFGPRNPYGNTDTSVSRMAALGTQTGDKKTIGFNYRGIFSATTFLEARYNKVTSEAVFPKGDVSYGGEGMNVYMGNDVAGVRTGLSRPFGFGQAPVPDARNNRSGNVNLKMFREFAGGNHEIDLGYDYYEAVRGTSTASGPMNRYYRVGGAYENAGKYLFPVINYTGMSSFGQDDTGYRGPAPTMQQFYGQDGTTRNRMDALYINDQWTVNSHLNVMMGLRYDMLKVIDTDGAQIGKSSDFSPRLQVVYDIKGDARHLVTFTAARFGGDFTTNFTDGFVKKANSTYALLGWKGNAITPVAGGNNAGAVQFVDYATLTKGTNYGPLIEFGDDSKTNRVAGNLKAPYKNELSLGYRRQWENGSLFKATYVYGSWKQDWAYAQDRDPSQVVAIQDPSGQDKTVYYVQGINVFNSDKMKRTYQGLELEWKMPLNSTWTLGGNWTYGHLMGNDNGGDRRDSTFRENTPVGVHYEYNHLTKVMGLSEDVFAPYGRLINDVPHRGRLYLSANLPLGKGNISYAWLLSYQSGANYDLTTSAPLAPYTETMPKTMMSGAPTAYTRFFNGRGQFQNNDTWQVDFKINFNVPLNIWKVMLIGDLSVTNLFNQSMEYMRSHAFYNTSSDPRNALFLNDPSRFGKTPRQTLDDNFWSNARSIYGSLGVRF